MTRVLHGVTIGNVCVARQKAREPLINTVVRTSEGLMLLLIGLRAIIPAPFISFNSVSVSLAERDL